MAKLNLGKVVGPQGEGLEFEWKGTELGVKKESDDIFIYSNLKGEKGDKGDVGPKGDRGEKGDQGDKGDTGVGLNYNWRGTELGIKREDESEYQYVNLKCESGSGMGDMLKEEYDKNNNGIVDKAEEALSVDWENIKNVPELGEVKSVNGKKGEVVLNAEDIKTNSGETVESQLSDIAKFDRKTYAELKTLKDSNQLKEGKRYVLTDYRTKYKPPDTDVIKEMEVEELILTASSTNTFESIVYSSKYPQDTIWYDFDNNKCEDKTTPRNGFITRRYDHITGNNVPQDWRTMLWVRWKPDVNQYYKNDILTNYSVWTSGPAVMGVIYKAGNKLLVAKNTNVPSKIDDSNVFSVVYEDITIGTLRSDKTKILSQTTDKLELKKGELHERLTFGEGCTKNVIGECGNTLHNNVFGDNCGSNRFGDSCIGNSFGNGCYYNSFGNGCIGNSFGNSCYSNSFGNGCSTNSFGGNCDYNSLGNTCRSNSFSNNCDSNSFGNRCDSNSFGDSCNTNSFSNYCSSNSVGNNCYSNSFGVSCSANSFGVNCYSNSFGNDCDSNSFGNYCNYNSFGNSCSSNSFGNDCRSNSFSNNCDSNSFGNRCDSNSFGNYCYNNSFNNYCSYIYVKALRNKTMIGLDIYSKSYTINIEKNNDGRYVFWYINSSNQPVYTPIP